MNNNWIIEAKEHFSINDNKTYIKDDEISKKSQEINEILKKILIEKFSSYPDLELNIQGSKWSVQGQNKLSTGIWYRAYPKEFGKNYPIVLGFYIGKNGLNIGIQIYNNVLGDLSLSNKLGEILKEVIDNKSEDMWINRDSSGEDYQDFGYFGLDSFNDEKFKEIIDVYQKKVYEINENILEKIINEFNIFLKTPSDVNHLSFGSDVGSFYSYKKEIINNFNSFIETPTYKNLQWWDKKSINSANMQGNCTNLIKNIEGFTLVEVKKLKDEAILEKVRDTFLEIKNLVFEKDNIKDNLNYDSLEKEIKKIEGMNATARELAYYIQMNEDKIPLVNGMTTDVLSHIENLTNLFKSKNFYTLQLKIDLIKKKIILNNEFEFKSYYVVDQLFNLLHKVSKKDLLNKKFKEMYQYAYLFANLMGKADKKAVEKDEFIDILQKGKNIIYYGAPGTGKTFTIKSNIENIVEDSDKQFVMTQFHPSYTYEDFIEGVKPSRLNEGVMTFELKDGEFKIFCEKAKLDEDNFLNEDDFYQAIKRYAYFFFVDEINRAELSRVFGELLYSLEYRGKSGKIKTQYSSLRNENEYFYIPENIFFIGTMNDVDRSIDSFDLALRRRFIWLRKDCDYNVIENNIEDINILSFRNACENLNTYIINIDGLNEKYQIGHAYFLKIQNYVKKQIIQSNLNDLFSFHIEPLLTEYLRTEYNDKDIRKHLDEARKVFKLEKN